MKRLMSILALAFVLLGMKWGPSLISEVSARSFKPGLGGNGGVGGKLVMGRLKTVGFEIGQSSSFQSTDGVNNGSGTGSLDTTLFRSGEKSRKYVCTGGVSQEIATVFDLPGVVVGEIIYGRAYFNFTTLPTANRRIMRYRAGAIGLVSVLIKPTGKVALFDDGVGQVGSDSAGTIVTGQWYRIEFAVQINGGSNDDYAEVLLDGVSVASSSTLNRGTIAPSLFDVGFPVSTTAGGEVNADDVAINDNSGANQNSWPGEGKIVLLKPISDAQVGSWTGGAGGVTDLWEAVNNTPPIGSSVETDLTQIESSDTAGDNPTDEYRANLTTYADAGIVAVDTVTVCQAVISHGEDVATGTKTGSFLILSNPAQAVADTFTFGDDVGALGGWPFNWAHPWGAAQYNPVVTLATSPVLRIRKTDTGSRVGSVCFAGIYVEYMPPAVIADGIMSPFGMIIQPL